MASARNLCQHSDVDGSQCTSNDYSSCPHCQLQLCLKHLNFHQQLLRSDVFQLADCVDELRCNLDGLVFDANNHRRELFRKLEEWYQERRKTLAKLYLRKKQELHNLCCQASLEFDTFKAKKDNELKQNLTRQLRKVLKQKQVHVDDLNEMRTKVADIERGLGELKQLLIDVYPDDTLTDIHIVKRRYVDAAKPSISIDDDDYFWDTNDDDDDDDDEPLQPSPSPAADALEPIITSTPTPVSPRPPDALAVLVPPYSPVATPKKEPLKFIIKRLQLPTRSTKVKYRLHTVATSPALRT